MQVYHARQIIIYQNAIQIAVHVVFLKLVNFLLEEMIFTKTQKQKKVNGTHHHIKM